MIVVNWGDTQVGGAGYSYHQVGSGLYWPILKIKKRDQCNGTSKESSDINSKSSRVR